MILSFGTCLMIIWSLWIFQSLPLLNPSLLKLIKFYLIFIKVLEPFVRFPFCTTLAHTLLSKVLSETKFVKCTWLLVNFWVSENFYSLSYIGRRKEGAQRQVRLFQWSEQVKIIMITVPENLVKTIHNRQIYLPKIGCMGWRTADKGEQICEVTGRDGWQCSKTIRFDCNSDESGSFYFKLNTKFVTVLLLNECCRNLVTQVWLS